MTIASRKLLPYLGASLFALALPIGAAMAAGGGTGGTSAGGSTGGATLAIPNDSNADADFQRAKQAIAQYKYEKALGYLQKVQTVRPNNPDVLNLIGFSNRKLGNQTEALEYYNKALALQPTHVGANEYLGELYLELKAPKKAEERLAVLKQACGNCEEYTELKGKIEKFETAQN
jgi:tetratricopeptide (TPR) repeat protein